MIRVASLTLLLLPSMGSASTTFEVDAGRGPVTVHRPSAVPAGTQMPLLVLLHGYTATSGFTNWWMALSDHVDDRQFQLALPDGEEDLFGFQAWNATDYCCGWPRRDDHGYLNDLLDLIESGGEVDPKQIYFVGHSNGGFMSYRMACDSAHRIAAIARLAGATFDDPADCSPSEPVSVLQIHGTADDTILFGGGCDLGQCYPSVRDTVGMWADYNACSTSPVRGPDLDIIANLSGPETRSMSMETCDAGGDVAAWLNHGVHTPNLNSHFAPEVLDWLFAHPKP